jgi:hypothetical protein
MAEQIEGSQEWDIVKDFETKLYALSGGKCLSKLNAGDVDENGLCAWLIVDTRHSGRPSCRTSEDNCMNNEIYGEMCNFITELGYMADRFRAFNGNERQLSIVASSNSRPFQLLNFLLQRVPDQDSLLDLVSERTGISAGTLVELNEVYAALPSRKDDPDIYLEAKHIINAESKAPEYWRGDRQDCPFETHGVYKICALVGDGTEPAEDMCYKTQCFSELEDFSTELKTLRTLLGIERLNIDQETDFFNIMSKLLQLKGALDPERLDTFFNILSKELSMSSVEVSDLLEAYFCMKCEEEVEACSTFPAVKELGEKADSKLNA